jgi:nickel-dependent lactate racemase
MKVRVPQLYWYEASELELDFPDSWEVHFCPPKGHDRPRLSAEEMQRTFDNPVGTPPLRELARGRKQVAILFDDISRPTRTYEIASYVLKELAAAGIGDDQIRFIAAVGTHGAHDNVAHRLKLGQEILERFPVYNHNPYENCVEVGTTSRGTPLAVNREVMSCDLKIGIGCVLPHPQVGFGGGGKIILPGVAHMDSVFHFHARVSFTAPETIGPGNYEQNVMRMDFEEACKLAGLDFNADCLVNLKGEITALFTGDPVQEHREAAKLAKEVYATERIPDLNVVVSNSFLKSNEAFVTVPMALKALGMEGGTLVVIMNTPTGQVVHYSMRSFGTDYGGRLFSARMLPPQFKVIVVNPFRDLTCVDMFTNARAVTWAKDWSEARQALESLHPNGAKVVVYPDCTIQYLKPEPAVAPAGTLTER